MSDSAAGRLCVSCFQDLAGAAVCAHCGMPANPPPASPLHLPPRTVLQGQYLLGRVLGHGGFGITYSGYDLNLARRLAVKEYLPNGSATRATGSREVTPISSDAESFRWGLDKFLEEARVLARFHDHPGIVNVVTFFPENGTAYLVMEHLEGQTLEDRLRQANRPVSFATAIRVMMPVMDALREVHKLGILHRDISPDNVMLCANTQVKLIDFGAARYALGEKSRNLSVVIKDGYAPEEQYRSKGNQGPWTDVYATAATIYRAITGQVPPRSLDRLHEDELADPRTLGANISQQAWAVLGRALAVRAADRFASMEDFQAALAQLDAAARGPMTVAVRDADPSPLPAPPVPPAPGPAVEPVPPPPPPVPKPFPWKIAAIAAAVPLLALAVWQQWKPKAEPALIASFRAEPASVEQGAEVVLAWEARGVSHVEIAPGVGRQQPIGSMRVAPGQSTSYTLTAAPLQGAAPAPVTLNVEVKPKIAPAPPSPGPVPPPQLAPDPQPQPETREEPRRRADLPQRGDVPRTQPLPAPPVPAPQPSPGLEPDRKRAFAEPAPAPATVPPAPQPAPSSGDSFAVSHDHEGLMGDVFTNNRAYRGAWNHCQGRLEISGGKVRFHARQSNHSFEYALDRVEEIKMNRRTIASQRSFHLKIRKGDNYNFVPHDSAQMVVETLQARLRK